jgi:hypothetical protein
MRDARLAAQEGFIMNTPLSDDELRSVATRRVKTRRELLAHVCVYLLTNLAFVGVWAITGAGYPWFLWPMIGWGIGVAFHAVNVALGLQGDLLREGHAIDREMERLRRSSH